MAPAPPPPSPPPLPPSAPSLPLACGERYFAREGELQSLYDLLSKIWVVEADESWNCPDNDELWKRLKEAGLLTQKEVTSRIIKTRRGPNNVKAVLDEVAQSCLPPGVMKALEQSGFTEKPYQTARTDMFCDTDESDPKGFRRGRTRPCRRTRSTTACPSTPTRTGLASSRRTWVCTVRRPPRLHSPLRGRSRLSPHTHDPPQTISVLKFVTRRTTPSRSPPASS